MNTKIQPLHYHLFHSINLIMSTSQSLFINNKLDLLQITHQPNPKPNQTLAMASTKNLSASIFILSILILSTFSDACGACEPKNPTKPKPNPSKETCPIDTLKLGVCADVLGLVNVVVGSPPSGSKCCALIQGLADVEAALCLCTAIKTNVLGINLNVPVSLGLLVSACEKTLPSGFTCP